MARHDDDDDDAFDERGLLKDRHTTRVPLMMRDGMSPIQRAVMEDKAARVGFDDSAARHQPGPVHCDAAGIERKAEAYRQMCAELQDAWRTPSADADLRGQKPGDACSINGAPGRMNARLECVPNRRDAVHDAAEGRRIKQEAYDAMCRDMVNAWKNPRAPAWKGNTNDREVVRKHNTGNPIADAYMDQLDDLTTAWSRKR
jgi:hypothetical protein